MIQLSVMFRAAQPFPRRVEGLHEKPRNASNKLHGSLRRTGISCWVVDAIKQSLATHINE